jgi:hypothetical protein
MEDFFQIGLEEKKVGFFAYPDWQVGKSKDLMVRAKNFYAIWDEEAGLWSTDEYDVQRIVDARLRTYHNENRHLAGVKYMRSFNSAQQKTFRQYMAHIGDNAHQLDEKLIFASQKVKREDYASKRLPYDLAPGDYSAWENMVSVLYKPEEKQKIEWCFGAVIAGASKTLQKFMVLYGPPGAGKGTIIDIALLLFDGYSTTFDAKALGSNGNQFAAAAFAGNPLLAIQHDGDMSRIEDNTTLNSIVSHEVMKVNEKYKPAYDTKLNAFLIMGTNKPVKITDAQSGLIRRLIDVHPSGTRLSPQDYHRLKDQIPFQLGAIAQHCLDVYNSLGPNYYNDYRPMEMMFKTNAFFNFIEAYYDIFEQQDGVSAKQAWNLYKEYAEEANLERKMSMYAFKAELGNYFEEYHERITLNGVLVRSYYKGFKAEPFKAPVKNDVTVFHLIMEDTTSLLNLELAEFPAQYASTSGAPKQKWDNVKTTLADLDSTLEHYVMVPFNLIVIDFDLKDENGEKSRERNLEAASLWPPTYAEYSKSGSGVHLHYYWDGDVEQLERLYEDDIEIKVFTGNAALRRRLTLCNNVPIAHLNSGLPLKEKKRVLDVKTFGGEKGLRQFVEKNLKKEYHPGTKSSVDFIKKGLDDAYESGMSYDLSDMTGRIIAFASRSSNQAINALRVIKDMKWKSEDRIIEEPPPAVEPADERLVFLDLEVYPNLLMIGWMFDKPDPTPDDVVIMINPKPHEVEALFRLKIVGFNVRGYDNHILWAAAMGANNARIYETSQKIISGAVGYKYGEAFDLSYTDILDYSTEKKSLKKFQIEYGLEHREMDLPWDQPVPDDRIKDVQAYLINDVLTTREVHYRRQGDFQARLFLADLSGLSPNHTTQQHAARIIFGSNRNPQRSFVYTKLNKEFPGYEFEKGKSTYRGEEVGEGGLVRSKPGLWRNVVLLDVASMHPTSIGELNLFGDEYTPRYMAIVDAQLKLKHLATALEEGETPDYDSVKGLVDGKLLPYIEGIEKLATEDAAAAAKSAKQLRYGLKIAMNIVYGLTSAKFDNPFRDHRNVDNIVAKRGALFMVDLRDYIEEKLNLQVVHIKTDSVKVVDASPDDIRKIQEFAAKYGYDMEHEATYDRFGLVNDAVYIAHGKKGWSATGAQYQHPYVFKKLFGLEDDISFLDLRETRSVQKGAIYLDFGIHEEVEDDIVGWIDSANLEVKTAEKFKQKELPGWEEALLKAQEYYSKALTQLVHVGKVGQFTPVLPGYGGGQIWRVTDSKAFAIQGTKNHMWVDSKVAAGLPDEAIDYSYFDALVEAAYANLEKYVEASAFESIEEFLP